MSNRYIIPEDVHELISEHFAERILKTLGDYNVELRFENAKELVDYEISLNRIVLADAIELEESGIFTTMSDKEKQSIMEKVKTELHAISMIKDEEYLKMGESYFR